ncbi:hypothetical protein [Pseudonocardia spinosispora]|uniref:hypothetical protein n=1 Tax=Pseudonocardia spinosispora TaxID=103441 RepID=UPI000400BBCF|nr:hypothetical protein [Pseudonocardia spinosispora]
MAVAALVLVSVTACGTAEPAGPHAGVALRADSSPVFDAHGFGTLKLGMSREQAQSTGLVAAFPPAGQGCVSTSWKADPARKTTSVYLSDARGVAAIHPPAGARTPEGIRAGSSTADADKAYPGVGKALREQGHAVAPAPGNPRSEYRLDAGSDRPGPHDVVTEIAVQLRDQDCYE